MLEPWKYSQVARCFMLKSSSHSLSHEKRSYRYGADCKQYQYRIKTFAVVDIFCEILKTKDLFSTGLCIQCRKSCGKPNQASAQITRVRVIIIVFNCKQNSFRDSSLHVSVAFNPVENSGLWKTQNRKVFYLGSEEI